MQDHLPFPKDSWVDLPRVYSICTCKAFPFRHYPPFFRRPETLSISISTLFPGVVTFRLRQWSRVWPCCPGSNPFPLEPNSPPTLIEIYRIRPPPVTRTLLPALTSFQFRGTSRYLEGLISQIDSPQLNQICICDFHWLFDFQVAQLFKFIDRSEDVKLTLIRHADVIFSDYSVTFEMYQCPQGRQNGPVSTSILCEGISGQVLFMAQVFSQPSAILSCGPSQTLPRSRRRWSSCWMAAPPPSILLSADAAYSSRVSRAHRSCTRRRHRGDGVRSLASP